MVDINGQYEILGKEMELVEKISDWIRGKPVRFDSNEKTIIERAVLLHITMIGRDIYFRTGVETEDVMSKDNSGGPYHESKGISAPNRKA